MKLVCRYLLITCRRRTELEINDTHFAATGLVSPDKFMSDGGYQITDLETGEIIATNFNLLENMFAVHSPYVEQQKRHYLRTYLKATSTTV